MNDYIEVHDFACDIARRAWELQLSRAENVCEIVEKAPKDVVTEVDLLCEKLMVDAIRERFPGDAILSEEQGGEIFDTGRTWLLDPVDGTANFTKANPMYCACVAVLEDGQVTHAAVAAPRIGDLYHARLGGGAFREANGQTDTLRGRAASPGGARAAPRRRRRSRPPPRGGRPRHRGPVSRALGRRGLQGDERPDHPPARQRDREPGVRRRRRGHSAARPGTAS